MRRDLEGYLAGKERGFLATVGESGEPTIVPVCFVYSKGMVYTPIDSKPKKNKRDKLARVANLRGDSRVAFIADTYSDDWRTLSYLLLHGRANLVTNMRESRSALEMLVSKYPQYRWLGSKDDQVIRIAIDRAKLWRFSRKRVGSVVSG